MMSNAMSRGERWLETSPRTLNVLRGCARPLQAVTAS